MTAKSTLATILLTGASLFAARPSIVHDAEDFEQPAVLQFRGITEQDEVRVDGEVVPAKGLARVDYNLMVAPGEYVVSVKLASSAKECISRVKVAAGEYVQPKCTRPVTSQMTD